MSKIKTIEQLEAEYEKASMLYHVTKSGTKAKELVGKRMDKAAMALEAYRINEKRSKGETISVFESLYL